MISNLFDALFGCWHMHYTFPITMRAGSRRTYATAPSGTYVVCLDCGKELRYDWDEMKVVSHPDHRNRTQDQYLVVAERSAGVALESAEECLF
jgi:hypothetical protein